MITTDYASRRGLLTRDGGDVVARRADVLERDSVQRAHPDQRWAREVLHLTIVRHRGLAPHQYLPAIYTATHKHTSREPASARSKTDLRRYGSKHVPVSATECRGPVATLVT